MRKVALIVFLTMFIPLISACETSLQDGQSYQSPNVVVPPHKPEVTPIQKTGILIIQEDLPLNDTMLSWRDRANHFISFSKGQKEMAEARTKINSYPNPAEIGEKQTIKTLSKKYGLDKDAHITSYKGKDKPKNWKNFARQNNNLAYILDFHVNEWTLKPDPKNKSRFSLELDMSMVLVNVEKETVQVNKTCYFAKDENEDTYSQYEIFSDDAKIMKMLIRNEAKKCLRLFNQSLEKTTVTKVSS